jgi:adenylosuccinate synthase
MILMMLNKAVKVNGATQIALTFLDHYDSDCTNVKEYKNLTIKCRKFIDDVERKANVPVTLLNTGKAYNCLIDLMSGHNIADWNYINKVVQTRI